MSPPPQARSTSTAPGPGAGGMCSAREAAIQCSAANSPEGRHHSSTSSSYWAGSLRCSVREALTGWTLQCLSPERSRVGSGTADAPPFPGPEGPRVRHRRRQPERGRAGRGRPATRPGGDGDRPLRLTRARREGGEPGRGRRAAGPRRAHGGPGRRRPRRRSSARGAGGGRRERQPGAPHARCAHRQREDPGRGGHRREPDRRRPRSQCRADSGGRRRRVRAPRRRRPAPARGAAGHGAGRTPRRDRHPRPPAARAATGPAVLNPAPPQPLPEDLLERVDVLVPNEHELAQLAGAVPAERGAAELAGLARSAARSAVVVTLGARGALVVPADGSPAFLQAPPPVAPVDTTGAGDCFCGALAQALAGGSALPEAVGYAVAADALSTTGPGARGALPGDDEVRAVLPRVPSAIPVS